MCGCVVWCRVTMISSVTLEYGNAFVVCCCVLCVVLLCCVWVVLGLVEVDVVR